MKPVSNRHVTAPPEPAHGERRRYQRFDYGLPMVVTGVDAYGDLFSEVTTSVNLSVRGVSFPLGKSLTSGETVRIQILDSTEKPHRWFHSQGTVVRRAGENLRGLSGESRKSFRLAVHLEEDLHLIPPS